MADRIWGLEFTIGEVTHPHIGSTKCDKTLHALESVIDKVGLPCYTGGNQDYYTREAHIMKYSRSDVRRKAYKIPELKFEQQSLTSFGGLVMFQELFSRLDFKGKVSRCFGEVTGSKIFSYGTICVQLVIHILLGYRELRDSYFYRDDPLVKRLLGLNRLPDVATISRALKDAGQRSVENLRRTLREMVLERLKTLALPRVTLDFDGSVQSTGRFAEGTAVGFNKKGRGRDAGFPAPPAQIRTCRFPAYGSYLGCLAKKRTFG